MTPMEKFEELVERVSVRLLGVVAHKDNERYDDPWTTRMVFHVILSYRTGYGVLVKLPMEYSCVPSAFAKDFKVPVKINKFDREQRHDPMVNAKMESWWRKVRHGAIVPPTRRLLEVAVSDAAMVLYHPTLLDFQSELFSGAEAPVDRVLSARRGCEESLLFLHPVLTDEEIKAIHEEL